MKSNSKNSADESGHSDFARSKRQLRTSIKKTAEQNNRTVQTFHTETKKEGTTKVVVHIDWISDKIGIWRSNSRPIDGGVNTKYEQQS